MLINQVSRMLYFIFHFVVTCCFVVCSFQQGSGMRIWTSYWWSSEKKWKQKTEFFVVFLEKSRFAGGILTTWQESHFTNKKWSYQILIHGALCVERKWPIYIEQLCNYCNQMVIGINVFSKCAYNNRKI